MIARPSRLARRVWVLLVACLCVAASPAVCLAAQPSGEAWVVYSNELGWLRVGTQAEFDEPWQKGQEIWGGTSTDPLKKELLRGGFASRKEALKAVCGELTRVRLKRHGLATPRFTTNGLYRGKEYDLRLDRGNAPEDVIWRGQEYDFKAETAVLRESGGITPRALFGAQYLCHVYKRDTREGPVDLNEWMCQPTRPEGGGFWIADEIPTYHHFYCDIWEGPFRDSFSLARAMKRHQVAGVKLWPESMGMEVNAADIPDDPRDFGLSADAVQPLVVEPQMLDWVIYATEPGWLRIGTRAEFNTPRPRRDEIWAGTSEEPIPKALIAEGLKTYKQALRELCAHLTKVRWQYVPNNEPRYIVLGTYRGKDYKLQLARDPAVLVAGGRGYDYSAERKTLADEGITPRLSFGQRWLAHSVRVGTMYGPQATNTWMLVTTKPEGGRMAVPDGTGGWFLHDVDAVEGPFEDNFGLAPILKARGVKSVALPGGAPSIEADWVPDDPRDYGGGAPPTRPAMSRVIPDKGKQGKDVFVTILGTQIEDGADVSFGDSIEVRDLTWFGRDPDSQDEQWLVTLAIADDAKPGKRAVSIRNYDGGECTGADLFEVIEVGTDLCPFVELVAPTSRGNAAAASDCARFKAEHEQAVERIKTIAKEDTGEVQGPERNAKLREQWRRLRAATEEMESSERSYWEALSEVIGDLTEEQIKTLVESLRERSTCLLRETQRRLDAWRETTFSPSDESPYGDRQREYKDTHAALLHTLKLWKGLAAMLQERRQFEVQMARRARALGEDQDLRPSQRRLCDVHLMQGEVSLLTEQAMIELGLQMQDSYGAALRETVRQQGQVNLSDKTATAAMQVGIVASKYFVGAFGAVFTGAVDTLKVWWNDTWLGKVWQWETLSADIAKRINQSRAQFDGKWRTMTSLRGTKDDEIIMLGRIIRDSGPTEIGDDLLALDSNRVWHEDTDGGMLRLVACFDDTYPQQMESEYRIMLRHAELSLRDMEQTLNIRMGADAATGEFSRWKRLLDPLGIIKTAFAEWIQGEFSTRIEFLGERKAELELMRGLLPRLQKIGFDLGLLAYLPKDAATHYALRCKNPDYLHWCIKMRLVAAKYREDLIEAALLDTWDDEEIHSLKRMRALNRLVPLYPLKHEWARWLQLQGADRLMMWDWGGAIACYEQAAQTDPQVQSPQGVERLREALDWQQTVEMGIDTFQSLGNQGMYAALFGVLGKWGGEALRAGGIDLGMAAAEPAATEAAEAAGFFGRATKYWGGFADFVWGQINPFSQLLLVRPEWDKIAEAIKGASQAVAMDVATREISAKLLVGYFGMEKEYADFVASAIVQAGAGAVETRRQLALQDALRLQQNMSKWQRLQIQIDLLRERADGRADVIRDIKVLEALRNADLARGQMELEVARRMAADWDFSQLQAKTQPLHEAEQQARRQVEPLTRQRVDAVSQAVLERLNQAKSQQERLETLVQCFKDLPFESLRSLFKGNVKESGVPDNFRREIQATIQSWFMEQFPQHAQHIVGFTTYGSAAHPDWPGYKRIWSDLDFTILLKPGTPKEVREAIKAAFDTFFTGKTGMPPEALDIHCYADEQPVFRTRLLWSAVVSEGTALSRALRDDPALAQRVFEESSESLRLIWRNMVDPERYLLPGNLVLFNYLVKMSGSMRSGELVKVESRYELRDDAANFDKVYGNVRFESWMGLDIVLDHLMHISHGRETLANDMFAYSKDLAKYSIRVLLARLIQTPRGLERMNAATAAEVGEAGGLEAFVIKVAKELPPRELGLKPDQVILLDEWIQRKEAQPFGEIFRNRNNGVRLNEKDFRLNKLIARHINQTEQFLLESIGFTCATQAAYLRQLMSEAPAAADPAVRAALEAKVKEIICSQSVLWQRLRPNERRLVQLKAPPGSDFWRMVELYNQVDQLAKGQSGDLSAIENWKPVTLTDDRDRQPPAPAGSQEGPLPFAEPVRAAGEW